LWTDPLLQPFASPLSGLRLQGVRPGRCGGGRCRRWARPPPPARATSASSTTAQWSSSAASGSGPGRPSCTPTPTPSTSTPRSAAPIGPHRVVWTQQLYEVTSLNIVTDSFCHRCLSKAVRSSRPMLTMSIMAAPVPPHHFLFFILSPTDTVLSPAFRHSECLSAKSSATGITTETALQPCLIIRRRGRRWRRRRRTCRTRTSTRLSVAPPPTAAPPSQVAVRGS